MRKLSTAILAACLGLGSWVARADAGLLSATGKIIAVLAGDLFVGEAVGYLGGAGTLAIHSQKNPALTCIGQFTSSAALGGLGQLQCSDGATATFSFKRLNIFRGYGVGTFSRGGMSFAYGLSAEDARPYLTLPAGKQLKLSGTELTLVDQ
jgi:hypothetical protein